MKKETLKNLVFVIVMVVIIVVIVLISINYHKKNDNEVYYFDVTKFENVSVIGLPQFTAILNSSEDSVTFFCSNENNDCYDELKALNEVMNANDKAIEYINVVELVDSEKEELSGISDIFKDPYYPNIVIIKNGKIVNNTSEFLNKEEIEDFLRENEVIA